MFATLRAILRGRRQEPIPLKLVIRDEWGLVILGLEQEIIENYADAVDQVCKTKEPVQILRNNRVWTIEIAKF